jgi:uncharacterized protein YndB with AHSA1/START domain
MAGDDFVLQLRYAAPVRALYEALATRAGIAAWWTVHTTFDDREGSVAEMRFPEAGFWCRMRVTALDPPQRVSWHCEDSRHPEHSGFADLTEWNGTDLHFEMGADPEPRPGGAEGSQLRFTHVGLVPRLECNDTCRTTWQFYLAESLRDLLETGRGRPFGAVG